MTYRNAEGEASNAVQDKPDTDVFQPFFTISRELLCIAGMDGRFRKVNPAWTTVLGYTEDELCERPFVDFVHDDDRASTIAESAKLADGVHTLFFENRYRCKDGSYKWLQWTATPSIENDTIYAVARDITEQRAITDQLRDREARLNAIVERAVEGILTFWEDGSIETINASAERIFGRSAAEVVGRDIGLLLPNALRSQGAAEGSRLDVSPSMVEREVEGLRRDGAAFPVEMTVAEIRGGERRLFLGIARDVSERKKVEGSRSVVMAREAHQLGRILTSSGILHDLGNALTGIGARAVDAHAIVQREEILKKLSRTADYLRTNLAGLEAGLGLEKARALVDLVAMIASGQAKVRGEALASMEKLFAFLSHAQELLTAHRAASGAGSGPARETMSLRKLLLDAQMMMSDSVAQRGGSIATRCDADVPNVIVERSRFMQVVINLIKNAVEATGAAPLGRPLEITLTAETRERGVRVEVRDNGVGFERDAEELFADGFSTKRRGSGLGLGAARRVIQSMGGTLELSSEGAGKGAAARITLPKEMLANE